MIILNLEAIGQPLDIIGTPQNIETTSPPSQPQVHPQNPQNNFGGNFGNNPPSRPPQPSQPIMSNPMPLNPNVGMKPVVPPATNRGAPQVANSAPPMRSAPPSSGRGGNPSYGNQQQQMPQNKSGNNFNNNSMQQQQSNRVDPIRSLNPYHARWRIKARVTNKTDIKYFKNSKGEGNLFSVDLYDSQGGEIRATFFNCDERFYHSLQKDSVYYFSKGSLKAANKKFTSIKNEYEIQFDNNAIIEQCEDGSDILPPAISYVPIKDIQNCQKDDIIGNS